MPQKSTSGISLPFLSAICLTSSIILYNAVDHLWSKGRLIPELDAYIEQSLKHLPKNDNKISTKGNIAKAVLFLASNEDSSFITGENIIVDGGLIYT